MERVSFVILLSTLLFALAYYTTLDLIARPAIPQGKFIGQLSFSTALFILGIILVALAIVLLTHEYFRVHSWASIARLSKMVKKKKKRTKKKKK